MESCAVPSSIDIDELVVKSTIARMLSDNYTLLIVCLIVLILLSIVLYYFVKQTYFVVRDYKRNAQRSGLQTTSDSEVYLDDTLEQDPLTHQEPGKQQFYKNVDKVFKDYNVEKTQYIASTYGRENDDTVDIRIASKKHDDYKYS